MSAACKLARVICAGLLLVAGSTAWAQPADGKKPAIEKPLKTTLVTRDEIPLQVTYYKSPAGKESPVLVLLHGKSLKGNRLVWEKRGPNQPGLADDWQKLGYAVITVDLRGHGDTPLVPPDPTKKKSDTVRLSSKDYEAMVVEDLEAVKRFIFDEHMQGHLNMAKLGIVAADMSAPIAVRYADYDWQKTPYDDAPTLATRTPRGQDVKLLVLLSPDESLPGLPINPSLNRMREQGLISVLIAVGKGDKQDRGSAKKILKLLDPKHGKPAKPDEAKEEHIYFVELETPNRGTDLLNNGIPIPNAPKPTSIDQLATSLFDLRLRQKENPWIDRRSRLERPN